MMRLNSLFSLPNLVGCIYLFLGVRYAFFCQDTALVSRGVSPSFWADYKLAGMLNNPLILAIVLLVLAFFSFRKKMFPLHLLAAFLWVFYVGTVCLILFSMLLGRDGRANVTIWEQLMMVGGAVLVCLPVFIYSIFLYRYGRRCTVASKQIGTH